MFRARRVEVEESIDPQPELIIQVYGHHPFFRREDGHGPANDNRSHGLIQENPGDKPVWTE
jgi:hypothetical protein